MKKLFILILIAPSWLQAQDYNVKQIPDSIKEGANAVKRLEELWVTTKSPSKAVIKHKYAITVLNEAGDAYAYYSNSYDKLRTLQDITGHLYDAEGKELKKVKKKDIQDVSYDDDMSLMTDDRIKRHAFYYKTYPYTVVYEDEQDFDGIFFLPHWQPMESEKFAVQQSSLMVEVPANYELRYKQFNYVGNPIITTQEKSKQYKWEVLYQKPILFESFMPRFAEITTSVFIAPSAFEVSGYAGNMSTWLEFGKFVSSLNANRDVLPDNVKADIHQLTDAVASKEEKVKLLYNYMQKNTRYISVQLGIGSWQPFDAKYVATKRYGDCKALSNYMVSILKEAGITANYVLINSGEGRKGLWEEFPAPYFNHAIMCVPDAKDTLWLECTSQTRSAGFMGSSTGNRKALLINADGGHLVNTPIYKSADNTQIRNVKAVVDETGNLMADVTTHCTGIEQELQHAIIHELNEEQRKKYLNNVISLPTYSIEKSEYKETKAKLPAVDEYLKISSPNYATITGKRLFITPNMFSKNSTRLSLDKERKFDIEYPYAYKDVDTVNITLPIGYTAEAMPKDVTIKNKFGNYSISFKVENNTLKMLRTIERNAALYPAADYKDLVKFYDDMYKADRSKIVLVKKEG
jgi:Domain of Unknown Function with PDB structure (DUF3857)/Domain of Unknown Function with PDB structure (DUF3858)/Transglutaminase-like superfamily